MTGIRLKLRLASDLLSVFLLSSVLLLMMRPTVFVTAASEAQQNKF